MLNKPSLKPETTLIGFSSLMLRSYPLLHLFLFITQPGANVVDSHPPLSVKYRTVLSEDW